MESVFQPRFQIISEVDVINQRSMNAHYSEGFRDLQTYSAGDKDWRLIILDQSVWNRDGRKA